MNEDKIQYQFEALLFQEITRPSTSPYNSALWVVSKISDDDDTEHGRMIINFRALNEKNKATGIQYLTLPKLLTN